MNTKLYKLMLFLFLSFLSLSTYSQNKQILDEWYTYESKDSFKGYIHYVVTENPDSYHLSTDLRIKTKNNEFIIFEMESNNDKDKYLTINNFSMVTNGEGGDKIYHLKGEIERIGDSLTWKVSGEGGLREIIKNTEYPTVDFFSMFFLLTKLDYSKKGRILFFNSMETSELNYKKNHYIDYVEDEVLNIKEQKIKARKLVINGDGIGESTYWVNEKNELVKVGIDNYKIMTRCKKGDLNFDLYELPPSMKKYYENE